MKTIVITGSSRGLGRGLADALLARGCNVVVGGRREADSARVAAELGAAHDPARVLGVACDVTSPAQVQALWGAAVARFGRVDVWINNAGVGAARRPLWTLSAEEARAVIDIDLLGTLYGAQTALRGMLAQGGGQIFNVEGFGSNGMMTKGMTVYGTSKSAVTYLTRSLALEARGTPVQVRALSPGIMDTEFLRRDYEGDPEGWNQARRTLNILADKVETVAPWLADKILASRQNGGRIAWLTAPKAAWRFATARIRPRRVID
mgnify:CR=1 FL=1